MRIGACQFALSGSVEENLLHMRRAVRFASERGVRLLLFPECALSGYPHEDVASVKDVDFAAADHALRELETLSAEHGMHIVLGSVEHAGDLCYNSAFALSPGEAARLLYRKRALWGWDREQFSPGKCNGGILGIDGWRVGVRICYEVRFPEYFRELYRRADCAAVLFCDRSEPDAPERYELIRAHLRTRAVENVMPLVCVNNAARWQTAPTMAIDEDGAVVAELARHEEGLLVYELERKNEPSFGARGRRTVSDALAGAKR